VPQEYLKTEQDTIRLKRVAKAKGGFFVEPEAKLAFVIRLRGINDMDPQTKKILQLLRLRQINNGVFIKITKATLMMLRRVEPYIMWGYPNLKSVKELVYKRGYGKVGIPKPSPDLHCAGLDTQPRYAQTARARQGGRRMRTARRQGHVIARATPASANPSRRQWGGLRSGGWEARQARGGLRGGARNPIGTSYAGRWLSGGCSGACRGGEVKRLRVLCGGGGWTCRRVMPRRHGASLRPRSVPGLRNPGSMILRACTSRGRRSRAVSA